MEVILPRQKLDRQKLDQNFGDGLSILFTINYEAGTFLLPLYVGQEVGYGLGIGNSVWGLGGNRLGKDSSKEGFSVVYL